MPAYRRCSVNMEILLFPFPFLFVRVTSVRSHFAAVSEAITYECSHAQLKAESHDF